MIIPLFACSRQRGGAFALEVRQGMETWWTWSHVQSRFVSHWFLLCVTSQLKSVRSLGTQIKNSLDENINYSPLPLHSGLWWYFFFFNCLLFSRRSICWRRERMFQKYLLYWHLAYGTSFHPCWNSEGEALDCLFYRWEKWSSMRLNNSPEVPARKWLNQALNPASRARSKVRQVKYPRCKTSGNPHSQVLTLCGPDSECLPSL